MEAQESLGYKRLQDLNRQRPNVHVWRPHLLPTSQSRRRPHRTSNYRPPLCRLTHNTEIVRAELHPIVDAYESDGWVLVDRGLSVETKGMYARLPQNQQRGARSVGKRPKERLLGSGLRSRSTPVQPEGGETRVEKRVLVSHLPQGKTRVQRIRLGSLRSRSPRVPRRCQTSLRKPRKNNVH